MHSSTTAVLLLLALFGTSIVDACDEHAAQAMAFTLSTNVSTWNGATDMFGLTKHDFHVTLTLPGQYKTELQLDCCCDSGQDIGSPASVCETKCNSPDLNVWKKETAVINGVEVEFDFRDVGGMPPALLEMGSAKKRLGNKAKVKNVQTWDGGFVGVQNLHIRNVWKLPTLCNYIDHLPKVRVQALFKTIVHRTYSVNAAEFLFPLS